MFDSLCTFQLFWFFFFFNDLTHQYKCIRFKNEILSHVPEGIQMARTPREADHQSALTSARTARWSSRMLTAPPSLLSRARLLRRNERESFTLALSRVRRVLVRSTGAVFHTSAKSISRITAFYGILVPLCCRLASRINWLQWKEKVFLFFFFSQKKSLIEYQVIVRLKKKSRNPFERTIQNNWPR